MPNITPVGAAVRVLVPKTENFNKYILPTFEIKCIAAVHPFAEYGGFVLDHVLKLGEIH